MLGPWHTDARTNMFFCGEKSYWKNDPWEKEADIKNSKLPKTNKLKNIQELLYIKTFTASQQCYNTMLQCYNAIKPGKYY